MKNFRLGSGPRAMLAGYLLFGFAPVFAKAGMQRGWDGPHAVVLRFCVAILLTLVCLRLVRAWGGRSLRREFRLRSRNKKGLFYRGLFGGVSALTYFISLSLAGAGLGTLLNYTYSIFANLQEFVFFGKRPSSWFWVLLALALCGLVLVVDPFAPAPRGEGFRWGVIAGIGAGFFSGLSIISIKRLRETDNAVTINSAYTLGSLALAIPVLLWARSQGSNIPASDASAWAFLLVSATLSFGGQILFNHGFKDSSVPQASVFALLAPAIAVWGGWAFLDEPLSPHFFAGALMILAAAYLASSPDSAGRAAIAIKTWIASKGEPTS